MWEMFAVMCVTTMMDCRTMYENPTRTFETKSLCLEAAKVKEKNTREMLTDEDGYLTVEHLEVGCERRENV